MEGYTPLVSRLLVVPSAPPEPVVHQCARLRVSLSHCSIHPSFSLNVLHTPRAAATLPPLSGLTRVLGSCPCAAEHHGRETLSLPDRSPDCSPTCPLTLHWFSYHIPWPFALSCSPSTSVRPSLSDSSISFQLVTWHRLKKRDAGTSLTCQQLRLCTSKAGNKGSIPSWGTKIPHATRHSQKMLRKQMQPKLSWAPFIPASCWTPPSLPFLDLPQLQLNFCSS